MDIATLIGIVSGFGLVIVSIMMGGGPSVMYGTEALAAVEEIQAIYAEREEENS